MTQHQQLIINSIKTAERTNNHNALQTIKQAIIQKHGPAYWTVCVARAREQQ